MSDEFHQLEQEDALKMQQAHNSGKRRGRKAHNSNGSKGEAYPIYQ
jgi:hypothetical protein